MDTISTRRREQTYKQTKKRNNAACTSCWRRRLDRNNKNVSQPYALLFCHSDFDNATENNGRTTWSNNYQKLIQCTLSPLLSILTPIHHFSAPLYAITSDYSYTTVPCPRTCTCTNE